jgi:P27 family predicted phage terminase small subunit
LAAKDGLKKRPVRTKVAIAKAPGKSSKAPLSAKHHSMSAKDGLKQGKVEQIETPITCPEWFDEYGKAEFRRVCRVLHDLGTLQDVNHATLEGYCAAYSRAVRAELALKDGFEIAVEFFTKTGDPYTVMKKKTEVAIAEKAWAQVKTFAVELGITVTKGPQEPPEDGLTPLEKALRAAEHKPR